MGDTVSEKRKKIATIAEGYVGSLDWAYDRPKGKCPEKKHKCNFFVYDVLSEADASPPTGLFGRWPITAEDWVDNDYTSLGWKRMGTTSSREKGDVIAKKENYRDATGHCGIAVSSSEVVAAGTKSVSKGSHGLESGTVVRYIGVKKDQK